MYNNYGNYGKCIHSSIYIQWQSQTSFLKGAAISKIFYKIYENYKRGDESF